MERREHEARKQEILEYLATLQVEEWMLLRLAAKVERCFINNPVGALRAFAANGWGPSDIFHWLTHNLSFRKINPYWSDSFYHIFFVEHLLIEAGLSKETAHSMAMTQAWIFWIPPVRLETAVKTFLKLGYDEEIIKHIANQMPHMFHMPETEIIDECKRASVAQRGLLWNTKLDNGPPPVKISAAPIRLRGLIDYRPRADPEATVTAKPTPVIAKKEPENIIDQTEIPAEKTTETQTEETQPPHTKLKPLKTFRPEMTPELIGKLKKKKLEAIIALDKKAKPKNNSSAEEERISVNPPPLRTYKPEPVPETVRRQKPVKERLNKAPTGEIEPENAAPALDIKRIQALIESSAKENDDRAWERFLEQNGWLKDKTSNQYQVCLALARWLPIHVQAAPYHLEAKGAPSDKLRFWVKVLKSKKIQKLLLMPPGIVEIRLFALRRIGRNFLKEPKWLLLPWETLSECELRYRINEIEARGKKAHLKPYIKMLTEPDRVRFLEGMDSFIERIKRRNALFLDDLYDEKDDDQLIYDRPEDAGIITPAELRAKLLAR